MILIGLTGGLASGKTTVARLFQQCGAELIDADQLARLVVQPGRAAWKDIIANFGREVLNDDQTLNRGVLANRVFSHSKKLKLLNKIVHPRVARERARITKNIVQQRPDAVIIYDAALLIEAKAHEQMDQVLVITADQHTQITRACKRDGLTRKEALARIRAQLSLQEKKRYADILIDGTLPIASLRKIVSRLYEDFSAQAQYQPHKPRMHKS